MAACVEDASPCLGSESGGSFSSVPVKITDSSAGLAGSCALRLAMQCAQIKRRTPPRVITHLPWDSSRSTRQLEQKRCLGLCCISKFPLLGAALTSCYEAKVCLNQKPNPFESRSACPVIRYARRAKHVRQADHEALKTLYLGPKCPKTAPVST